MGSFEGILDYDGINTLTVSLTNTSPDGGYLTAFALNNPGDSIESIVSWSSTDAGFTHLLGDPSFNNSVDTSPFGNFDFGSSSTKDDWLGGGNPQGGIGSGETAIFTFQLSGIDLDALTTQNFISEYNQDDQLFFAARIRGFNSGGSDKVPGAIGPLSPDAIPEPSTFLLLGSGILGVLALVWKRKRQ